MTIESIGEPDSPMLRAAGVLAEAWGAPMIRGYASTGGVCDCPLGAACKTPAKHPIGARWPELATADPDELRRMFAGTVRCNIGMATGRIVVLDVDGPAGEASLAQYPPLPPGPRYRTARGWHAPFRAPLGVVLHNRAGARGRGLGEGLDLRAEGGFVIVPPSVHASGVVYEWLPGCSPADLELPECPAWIVERARELAYVEPLDTALRPDVISSRAARWAEAAFTRELDAVRTAAVGTRNTVLNTAAFNLAMIVAGGQLDGGDVKRALLGAALEARLSELEAHKTIKSGFAAGLKREARRGPVREQLVARDDAETRANEPRDSGIVSGFVERRAEVLGGEYFTTDELFEPLGAARWCVADLQMGPGRPTLFVGFGASAKTYAAQSLALALAAGHGVWERFECTPTSVLHLDFEQGKYATAKRYQRLALGHGIDWRELEGRLRYVELPKVYLDARDARDQYMRACEGVELVIVDSLRGASPSSDENDSGFRATVDTLTAVSQRQGSAVLVLHHAAKPRAEAKGAAPADARTLARGTGAIFDAAGCVLNFVARPGDAARLVQQVKMPAEAEGAALDPFELVLEDVTIDGVPNAGLRVLWRKPVVVDEDAKAAEAFERDAARILKAIRQRPGGATTNVIVARAGMGRNRTLAMLGALADEGRLVLVKGPRNSKVYRILADEAKP